MRVMTRTELLLVLALVLPILHCDEEEELVDTVDQGEDTVTIDRGVADEHVDQMLPDVEDDADDLADLLAEVDVSECGAEHLNWGRGGEFMHPGSDCLTGCHEAGGSAESTFTLAGTVLQSATCPEGVEGAIVHVVDAEENVIDMTSNEEGNFFTDEAVVKPYSVSVEVDEASHVMMTSTTNGSCGFCHSEGSALGFVW